MAPTAVKTPSLTSSASRTQTLKLTSATPASPAAMIIASTDLRPSFSQ